MGIFGRSRRQVFKPSPYETRRRRRGLPRWLILLIIGILIGSGGTLMLQSSYGPKRLTVLESQRLTDELSGLSLERQQLNADVAELTRQLESRGKEAERTIAGLRSQINELEQSVDPLRQDVSLFTQAMTAGLQFDPIGITGARFVQAAGSDRLTYHVLLVQEDDQQDVYNGRIEVTFEGRYPNGRAGAIKALVAPFELKHYQHLQGTVELPNSLQATRATLRVYQAEGQRALSFRTYQVER